MQPSEGRFKTWRVVATVRMNNGRTFTFPANRDVHATSEEQVLEIIRRYAVRKRGGKVAGYINGPFIQEKLS